MASTKSISALMSRVSPFSVTFTATLAASVVLGAWGLSWHGWQDHRSALLVMFAGAVLFETWPLTVLRFTDTRGEMNPYTIHLGQTFGFATLFVWGVQPAIVITGVSWLVGQFAQRRPWWRSVFNAGQFMVCIAVAGAVMGLLGGRPIGVGDVLSASELGWVVGAFVAYFVVNDLLIALLYESDGSTFWTDLTEGTRWYLFAEILVDTLSIVVVVLVAQGSLYPLALVIPMALFSQTYAVTRSVEHESLHDDLTGLANRRQLIAQLQDQVSQGSSYAVVIIDLDHFKGVNDSYGHRAGDAVLVRTAERLRSVVRDTDIVSRPSGDEFVVVLRDRLNDEESVEVARRIYRVVARPVSFEDELLEMGASVGVLTVGRTEVLDIDAVLHRADLAMYRAKRGGGGVVRWVPGTPESPHQVEAAS